MNFSAGIALMRTILLLLLIGVLHAHGQTPGRVTLALQADIVRSNHDGFFRDFQLGAEGRYAFAQKFSATAGLEWWTEEDWIAAAGLRYYPVEEAFVRVRALPGVDGAVGGGFSKPLSDHLRFEAITDFYVVEGVIAIRAGLAWSWGTPP